MRTPKIVRPSLDRKTLDNPSGPTIIRPSGNRSRTKTIDVVPRSGGNVGGVNVGGGSTGGDVQLMPRDPAADARGMRRPSNGSMLVPYSVGRDTGRPTPDSTDGTGGTGDGHGDGHHDDHFDDGHHHHGHHHDNHNHVTRFYHSCYTPCRRHYNDCYNRWYRPWNSFYTRWGRLSGCTSRWSSYARGFGYAYYRPYYSSWLSYCPTIARSLWYDSTPVTYYDNDDYALASPCDVTMAQAWTTLAEGLPLESIDAFACHAQVNPYDGLPKIGYSLSAAMLGHDDDAITVMRDAISVDVEALQYVPADEHLTTRLGELVTHYEERARTSYGDVDSLFMVATLRVLRSEYSAAAYALDVGTTLGDDDETTRSLWELLDAIAE